MNQVDRIQPDLESSYTPLPQGSRKGRTAGPDRAAIAGAAGLLGVGVILAFPLLHKAKPAETPTPGPAQTVSVSHAAAHSVAPSASVSLAPADLRSAVAPAVLTAPHDHLAAPIVAAVSGAVNWAWPSALSASHRVSSGWQGFLGKHADLLGPVSVARQILAGWDPSKPAGHRMVYNLQMLNGSVQQVDESQLPARRLELVKAEQAARAQAERMAEADRAQIEQRRAAETASGSGSIAYSAPDRSIPAHPGTAPARATRPAARQFRAANGAAHGGAVAYGQAAAPGPQQTAVASSWGTSLVSLAAGLLPGAALGGSGAGTTRPWNQAADDPYTAQDWEICRRQQNGQDLWQGGSGNFRWKVLSCDPSKPFGQRRTYEDTMVDAAGAEHKTINLASPLVFDLSGSGVQTGARDALFDIDGQGRPDSIRSIDDLAPGMGVLVFDNKKDGKPGQSGLGLFGDRTDLDGDGKPDGFVDGFAALRAFAEKAVKEGVLTGDPIAKGRLEASDLAALEKAYGLKMKVGGFNREPVSLAKAGVAAIALSEAPRERAADFDGKGNELLLQPGATFTRADGSTGTYADVWLTRNASRTAEVAWTAPLKR